jgi:hypothetical protein
LTAFVEYSLQKTTEQAGFRTRACTVVQTVIVGVDEVVDAAAETAVAETVGGDGDGQSDDDGDACPYRLLAHVPDWPPALH